MADASDDPMARLREVLGRPDRRTWRRFLPQRGAPRSETAASPTDLDEPRRVDENDTRRLQPWQIGAGVFILAGGIVLATGLVPAEPPPPTPEGALAPEQEVAPPPPAGVPAGGEPAPPTSTTDATDTAGVRLWPSERVEVTGRLVRTDSGRWEVGRDGDVVTVGDWDCDRLPTPAVLRPSDGRVAVFDRWAPAEAEEQARPVGTIAGAVGLRPSDTCGEIVVRSGAGGDRLLDTRTPGEEADSWRR